MTHIDKESGYYYLSIDAERNKWGSFSKIRISPSRQRAEKSRDGINWEYIGFDYWRNRKFAKHFYFTHPESRVCTAYCNKSNRKTMICYFCKSLCCWLCNMSRLALFGPPICGQCAHHKHLFLKNRLNPNICFFMAAASSASCSVIRARIF